MTTYNLRGKRKFDVMNDDKLIISSPSNKKSKTLSFSPNLNYIIDSSWMAISKSRNAALKDYCLDYFEMYNIRKISDKPRKSTFHKRNQKDEDTFKNFLLTSGNKFEEKIINEIKDKFKDKFVKITEPWLAKDKNNYVKTLNAMKEQIPIIYQGILHNPNNKTYGAVDLLIREDYVGKLINKEEKKEGGKEEKKIYSYRVLDIKWSTLHFNIDKNTIRNNINVKPFKTQLYLYNKALEYSQDIKTDIGYILGKGWIMEKFIDNNKVVSKSDDPFDRLGEVEFYKNDKSYQEIAEDAIDWYSKLITSVNWTHDPPSNKYLHPNMSNSFDNGFSKLKYDIANKYDEITNIWQCGVYNRNLALANGIKSFKDKDLTCDILGITGKKTRYLVKRILKVNREDSKINYLIDDKDLDDDWKKDKFRVIIDFESIGSVLINSDEQSDNKNNCDIPYLIGIVVREKKNIIYEPIILEDLSDKNIKTLLINSLDYIGKYASKNKLKSVNIYHYTKYETSILSKLLSKHNIKISNFEVKYKLKYNFIDFHQKVKDMGLAVKGATNYKLKHLHRALYNLGYVFNKREGDKIVSGEDAMYYGWKYYKDGKKDDNHIKSIISYNKDDCVDLLEIIEWTASL